ncbi:MAG TPA: VWA domain-containing protein [Chitinispirillaceae bacterium]|nr:VWA domain-containing protein [Chitinispirillaceae bacterium]
MRERKYGTTIVFVVDSSGSMGAQRRMSATKGAIMSLLLDAYQKRDRIAMVAFKGNDACVVLPPTDSIDLGKKSLETLPTGGKTPLSAGLLTALRLFGQEDRKGNRNNSLMIFISDGRANVSSSGGNAFNDALNICEEIRSAGIQSIVIDTETGFIKLGKMRELADKLDGKYYQMEQLQADQITGIIGSSMSYLKFHS